MNFFVKHEIQDNNGQFEVVLYLNKTIIRDLLHEESFNCTIKNKALIYIESKLGSIPIKVVRIKLGSILFFSFIIDAYKRQMINRD